MFWDFPLTANLLKPSLMNSSEPMRLARFSCLWGDGTQAHMASPLLEEPWSQKWNPHRPRRRTQRSPRVASAQFPVNGVP